MAKILAPYALCPLTERKRFVGVSPDSEGGCVIVTLARNIIIRYRLSNQKQVSSWSTSTMLTAPVIYDHSSKRYYGIFKSDEVSSWEEGAVSLGKLDKTKFIWLIHSIVSSEDCPAIIVYKNGVIGPLKTDLTRSKQPPDVTDDLLLPTKDVIKDTRLVSLGSVHYVAIYSLNDKGETRLLLQPVDQDRGTRSSIILARGGVKLTAHTIIDGDSPHLITLWSNGELFSLGLPIKGEFPGKRISIVECIDASQPAVLLQLGQQHIVLYGAAPNSEGSFLVILSRQFGLPEASTKMKVYDEECRMWICRSDIVLVLGGHLVVAPFKLASVKLISLIGAGKKTIEPPNKDVSTALVDNTDAVIFARICQMRKEGYTQYAVCDIIIDELIKSKNIDGLKVVFKIVTDIPDSWLIQLALYALEDDTDLLKHILRLPLIGDNETLALVRQKVMLEPALKLMTVITKLLKEDDIDKCILDWASLLCDASYLQCLLSKDEHVVSVVRQLQEAVEEHIDSMVTYRSLLAEINYFKRGKVISNTPSVSSHSYVVEKIKLY